ncbi:hypothetical protein JMJ35_002097 [Cladonia borealis]|uniref:DUF1754-domain-containing protein n=1 Tax=Cladonia borealis TaxID=184061 RepID=A0AA39R743_9LECA|nr:hypothetical protein JMJ35_002097 [Cladonia borealis]
MPSDDYSAAKPKPAQSAASETVEEAKSSASAEGLKPDGEDSEAITRRSQDGSIERDEEATSPPAGAGKTEAELRHEERRRKRLDERLKREGTKTHKERVEELNRYLSNLSEHHDMPRIGPG